MSLHLPPPVDFSNSGNDSESDCTSSGDDDDDQNWDDWVSDSLARHPCRSLFDEKSFPSVEDALLHDKSTHNFDLNLVCTALGSQCFLSEHRFP